MHASKGDLTLKKTLASNDKIGIIAGNGKLPMMLIKEIINQGSTPYVVIISNEVNKAEFKNVKHQEFALGEVGKMLDFFKSNGVSTICFAGGVKRPANLRELKVDFKGGILLARILKSSLFSTFGDDNLLRAVASFLEDEGFKVVPMQDIVNNLFLDEALFTKHTKLNRQNILDIDCGFKILCDISKYDIGQSIIINNNQVIGIEGVEGTAELIKRCGEYNKYQRGGGVLIKAVKKGQDQRFDMPTIGPDTIIALAQNGFSGIAVAAFEVIVVEKEKTIALAEENAVFLYSKIVN